MLLVRRSGFLLPHLLAMRDGRLQYLQDTTSSKHGKFLVAVHSTSTVQC
jgi:hypothetical protein